MPLHAIDRHHIIFSLCFFFLFSFFLVRCVSFAREIYQLNWIININFDFFRFPILELAIRFNWDHQPFHMAYVYDVALLEFNGVWFASFPSNNNQRRFEQNLICFIYMYENKITKMNSFLIFTLVRWGTNANSSEHIWNICEEDWLSIDFKSLGWKLYIFDPFLFHLNLENVSLFEIN